MVGSQATAPLDVLDVGDAPWHRRFDSLWSSRRLKLSAGKVESWSCLSGADVPASVHGFGLLWLRPMVSLAL